ncbi:hypothetical protein ATO6_10230 [Oceanicola sp. 22II-s10i]|uniref:LysR family transcriptional regulator n=1 Tax=Oceanicola sp. 22II-s10i TaxID=1317116 RepID=UPI000B70FC58|nr:LysR family transcriptional regulator [Oceanicola sp. 22II-s10i]OWU84712.1 hypothetical protein ATO6_10230 [Oceanicola sp. 22II-s10i]
MELKQLTYFCEVAAAGSFSKAAVQLSIVQPALSRQISRLEEEVGVKLFYRNGRGVEPTPEGLQLLDTAHRVLGDLQQLQASLAGTQKEVMGRVSLAMPPSVDGLIGAAVVERVRTELPRVQLHISEGFSGHVAEWLMTGRVDLGVVHQAGAQPSMQAEVIIDEPLHLVGRPSEEYGLVAEQGGTFPVSGLARLPLLQHGENHGLRRLTDRMMSEAGLSFKADIEVDAIATIRKLLRVGKYYGVLPVGYMEYELSRGDVFAWRLVEPGAKNVMTLAMSPNRPFTVAVEGVRKIILAEARRVQKAGVAIT